MDSLTRLRILLIRNFTGDSLTSEEQGELAALLREVPGADQVREEVERLPREEIMQIPGRLDIDAALKNVYAREADMRRRKQINIRNWTIAAASICLLGLGTYFTFRTFNKAHPTQLAQNTAGATLELPDGRIVSLQDSGTQTIQSGKTAVLNTNRVLTLETSADITENENWVTLRVPPKMDYQLRMDDGTNVYINSASVLRIKQSKSRDIFLDEGEAFFEVVGNAQHPFAVHTGRGVIRVLGTSFNVNAYETHRVVTSLVSGKVSISAGIDSTLLLPGKEAVITGGVPIHIRPFDPAMVLGWRTGTYYFTDANIKEISKVIKRWYDVDVVIDNPQLDNITFRGVLKRNNELQNFIDNLSSTEQISFQWKDGKLHCR